PPATPETTPPSTPVTTPTVPPGTVSSTPPASTSTTTPAPTHRTSSASSDVPTAVNAGLPGPPTRPAAVTGDDSPSEAGSILMTLGGMLLAGGAIGSLRRHGRHTR
ncbi:hypothetical protein ABZX12_03565, partial [Kribbella sp. NPDC003505]